MSDDPDIGYSDYLLGLVVASLLGPGASAQPPVFATDAADRIFRPGDWPTQDGQYPILKLSMPSEDRQGISRSGAPQFITTLTIRIRGEVSEPAQVDDAGASAAEASLQRLKRQVERAVVGSYPFTSSIQQIASMRSQLAYNSDAATHLAGIQIDMSVEFYEGPESFAPIASDEVAGVHLETPTYPGNPGFTVDFQQ